MRNLKMALLNIKKNFQNAKELKASFVTSIVGMCINDTAIVFLWYYFGNVVGNINGWDPMDIFGLYGINATTFGVVTSFFYGLNNVPTYIATGAMDKFLLTPKNTLIKVVTSAVSTAAMGDILFGLICFTIFAVASELTFLQVLISLLLMVTASIILFSFLVVCMSVSFYLMDGDNISQGLSGLLIGASLYHGGAFTGVLKSIFIFVVPSLLLGAIPVEIVKTMDISRMCLAVGLSVCWLTFSVWFFYRSLKKYESNSFFGFGN